jgi:antitoxin ParD1/3/4/toxin ParE1/3/4
MSRFRIASSAARDLADISAYLVEEDPAAALKVLSKLREAMVRLARLPGMGHRRPDLSDDPALRFWRVYSWLIIYEADVRPIRVVRVLRGERDIESLLP